MAEEVETWDDRTTATSATEVLRAMFGTDWEGRISFAGEAASRDSPATVYGAPMMGREAAAAVLAG